MQIKKLRYVLVASDEKELGVMIEKKAPVRMSNLTESEATQHFRSMLVQEGLKEYISTVDIPREKSQVLKTIALFGVPLKCHFAFWTSKTDTDNGRASLFVGQPNHRRYKEASLKHSIVVEYEKAGKIRSRIVHEEIPYFAVVVTNRSFRKGSHLSKQNFVEYLIIPLEDIIQFIKDEKQDYLIIKKAEREKYAFSLMLDQIKERSKDYESD